jgi:hypothetical protein
MSEHIDPRALDKRLSRGNGYVLSLRWALWAATRSWALTRVLDTGFVVTRLRAASWWARFFADGGDEVAALGVSSSRVVPGQPPQHLSAAGGGIVPAAVVVRNFAVEGGVERFGKRVVRARTDAPIDWGDPPRHRSANSIAVC